jgi:low affinity Fe/Cu permease
MAIAPTRWARGFIAAGPERELRALPRRCSGMSKIFTRFATTVSKWTGRPVAFILCCALVLVWALSGPLFGFSDTWQLVINTTTTIVTFLMVFLIQNTQNRDNAAIQAKLDEIIRTSDSDNKFIGIEHLSDEELEAILKDVEKSAQALHEERRKRERGDAKAPTRKRKTA